MAGTPQERYSTCCISSQVLCATHSWVLWSFLQTLVFTFPRPSSPPNDSGLMMYQLAAAAAVYNSVCLLEYNTYFLFSPIAREYNNHALCLICSTLLLY